MPGRPGIVTTDAECRAAFNNACYSTSMGQEFMLLEHRVVIHL